MNGKILICLLLLSQAGFAQYQYPFQDPDLDSEKRIDNLLSIMTLDEKVACLSTKPDIPRLGVTGAGHVEGLHGLAKGGPSDWGQKDPHVTTIFPQAIGLANTWDTALIRKVAEVEAYETRYLFQSHYQIGGLVVRAPNADLGRDVRWGRNEECYGEDAWFNATMVTQFVKGLQGHHPKYWMTASLMKHFLANSNEKGRDSTSSNFSERLFYEYYSYPFYKGITDGGCRAFMAAYNSFNNIPMAVHPVLKEVTLNKWGQNGIICTDGGAYTMLITAHHYSPDLNHAAAACINAGINQFLDKYREGIYGALANGYIQEQDIDSVLRGVFRVMIKLGQLDPDSIVPYKEIGVKDTIDPWTTESHKKLALEATRKSIVLLKNESGILPLDLNKIKSIAVIGRLADTVMLDWYSGTPPYRITPLQGIKNLAGDKVKVGYAKDNSFNRAVELARSSDIAIVVVGNDPTCNAGWARCPDPGEGKEAVDRKSLELSDEQLIRQVYGANKNTIVVLQSSFPYAINWTQQHVPGILHMTHCSQETGSALADVLFGIYNPAGRLVETWPASLGQLPDMMDYDITNGRTYMYFHFKPLYSFGYGLSYSTFEYSKLQKKAVILSDGGILTIKVDVKNNGPFDGEEVVQLYVAHEKSAIKRPIKELKGFQRVFIKKGETKTVNLNLHADDLKYWNEEDDDFELETDMIRLLVGTSSDDIRLSTKININ